MKYKYVGDVPVILTTLNLEVLPGDVVEVADPINHLLFKEVKESKAKTTDRGAN